MLNLCMLQPKHLLQIFSIQGNKIICDLHYGRATTGSGGSKQKQESSCGENCGLYEIAEEAIKSAAGKVIVVEGTPLGAHSSRHMPDR